MGVVAVFGVLVGMAFPLIEGWNKTNGFNPARGFSLDGKRDFYLSAGDEMKDVPNRLAEDADRSHG